MSDADNSLDDVMHPDGTMRSRFAPTDSEDDHEPCPTEGCDNLASADGDPCASCQAEHDYWRSEWERYGRREYNRDLSYVRDMREAGRGYLLREDER